jgi:hypothetical protein
MEATTAAVEAPTTTKSTAMEAASAAHAASVSTTAAATSVTATTTTTTTTTTTATATATATAATSECRSWLNQADRCQCEQGYNRFSHSAFPSLDEAPPKAYKHFRSGIIRAIEERSQ